MVCLVPWEFSPKIVTKPKEEVLRLRVDLIRGFLRPQSAGARMARTSCRGSPAAKGRKKLAR